MNFTPAEDSVRRRIQDFIVERESVPNIKELDDLLDLCIATEETYRKAAGLPIGIDRSKLRSWILTQVNIDIGLASVIQSDDHTPWLSDKKGEGLVFDFWQRYEKFLLQQKFRDPKSVNETRRSIDEALDRLGNPANFSAGLDRRGLVVGEIQSGKTQHYIGLVNRAIDVGYKIIVVLAGRTNALRTQTQMRIDEGVLGRDTSVQLAGEQDYQTTNLALGYGVGLGDRVLPVDTATHAREIGDFRSAAAQYFSDRTSDHPPAVFVVKKNVSVLDNVIRVLTQYKGEDLDRGLQMERDLPLLVIDDEADDASVNIKIMRDPDTDPSRTNGQIRKLLHSFRRASYVGYTATPFANIFIPRDGESDKFGKDLFPRDFIIRIPEPSNHFGPKTLFGLSSLDLPDQITDEVVSEPSMPLTREVIDEINFITPKHRKDHKPGVLPNSLKEAMYAFFLTQAARNARGQEKEHNSMLIHVTRFVAVQEKIFELVDEFQNNLINRIQFNPVPVYEEFKRLWDADFIDTSRSLQRTHPEYVEQCEEVSWNDVKHQLDGAISRTEIQQVNGNASEPLQYKIRDNAGYSVILIGGDKLSRGLTLEGLSIAYYLRDSRAYDTLLQMGRWFGYRPGYMDLCRIYAQPSVIKNFQYIVQATEELKYEFDQMQVINATPAEFGLRVQNHPGQLLVTSQGKMRSAKKMKLDWSDRNVLNFRTSIEEPVLRHNYRSLQTLVEKLEGDHEVVTGDLIWRQQSSRHIIEYLDSLRSINMNTGKEFHEWNNVAQFVRRSNENAELVNWTILISSNSKSTSTKHTLGGYEIGLGDRPNAATETDSDRIFEAAKGNPTYPRHRYADLSAKQLKDALDLDYERDKSKPRSELTKPKDVSVRRVRGAKNALLIVYGQDVQGEMTSELPPFLWSIGFPANLRDEGVEYVVNQVQQENDLL